MFPLIFADKIVSSRRMLSVIFSIIPEMNYSLLSGSIHWKLCIVHLENCEQRIMFGE
jgi:hypothetical protein